MIKEIAKKYKNISSVAQIQQKEDEAKSGYGYNQSVKKVMSYKK